MTMPLSMLMIIMLTMPVGMLIVSRILSTRLLAMLIKSNVFDNPNNNPCNEMDVVIDTTDNAK